jgi:hypothetical protein
MSLVKRHEECSEKLSKQINPAAPLAQAGS